MRKKKKQKQAEPQHTMIGRIVDMPLEDFKEELVKQKVSIGVISNLKLNLVCTYNDLMVRKDAILKSIVEGTQSKDDPVVMSAINGLYAEMTKIEQKVLYLNDRIAELANLDGNTANGEVDSNEK